MAQEFEKKDYIFSETMGVCLVKNVTHLSMGGRDAGFYYELQQVKDKSKVSFIPVENHQVVLRSLVTKDEAKEYIQSMENAGKKPDPLRMEEAEFVLSEKNPVQNKK